MTIDSFDERFKKASEEFPEVSHYNRRVELYEEKHNLKPFTPAEILAQRRLAKKNAPQPGGPVRECPDCGKWMIPRKVCGACLEGRKGNKTLWTCVNQNCGSLIYSKRTIQQWIQAQ